VRLTNFDGYCRYRLPNSCVPLWDHRRSFDRWKFVCGWPSPGLSLWLCFVYTFLGVTFIESKTINTLEIVPLTAFRWLYFRIFALNAKFLDRRDAHPAFRWVFGFSFSFRFFRALGFQSFWIWPMPLSFDDSLFLALAKRFVTSSPMGSL